MIFASTMPVPIVFATCSPKTAKAMKLKNAAHMTAVRGFSTRVDTTVAIEFAASCSPFMKSNSSATPTRPNRRTGPSAVSINGVSVAPGRPKPLTAPPPGAASMASVGVVSPWTVVSR